MDWKRESVATSGDPNDACERDSIARNWFIVASLSISMSLWCISNGHLHQAVCLEISLAVLITVSI